MSRAELKAQYLFDTLNMDTVDEEVRRHLMILLLTVPSKPVVKQKVSSDKKNALERLAGCITLPDTFDYKTSMPDALEAKFM